MFWTVVNASAFHKLSSHLKTFLKYWLPVLIWLSVIFIGSTDILSAEHTSRFLIPFLRWLDPNISFATIAKIHFSLRKIGHLTEYAILAALFWRALRSGTRFQAKMSILFLFAWLAAAIFAVTDEFHQSFVPTRTASPKDVLIDVCGALIGLAICLAFAGRAKRESEI